MVIPPSKLSFCRAIAARASADERTVYRILKGEKVRGMVAGRILRALREAGVELPKAPIRLTIVRGSSRKLSERGEP
jgi:hypothetical protein